MEKGDIIFLKSDGMVISRTGDAVIYKSGDKFIIDRKLHRRYYYVISNGHSKYSLNRKLITDQFYTISEHRKKLIDSL